MISFELESIINVVFTESVYKVAFLKRDRSQLLRCMQHFFKL